MKEIDEIKTNYEMGFITPHEFLCELCDILEKVGAQGELINTMNETLASFANFIMGDILNASDANRKQFKDFLNMEG